jgi:transposase
MSSKPITMRKIKEVLRLRLACGLSLSEIARALQLSKGVAAKYVDLARQCNLDGAAIEILDEAQLASHLLAQNKVAQRSSQYVLPNFARVHQELKNKCMTLQLLWHEYVASADGKTYSYSAFCERYSHFRKILKHSMRMVHKAVSVQRIHLKNNE